MGLVYKSYIQKTPPSISRPYSPRIFLSMRFFRWFTARASFFLLGACFWSVIFSRRPVRLYLLYAFRLAYIILYKILHMPACNNCHRSKCKGKCIPRSRGRKSPASASATSNTAQTLEPGKHLDIPPQRNTGSRASSTSYPSSFQSTRSTTQTQETALGSNRLALQPNQVGPYRVNEWLTQNRGIPFERLHNSFPQPSENALQNTSTTAKYQCPQCGKRNKDRSKLR